MNSYSQSAIRKDLRYRKIPFLISTMLFLTPLGFYVGDWQINIVDSVVNDRSYSHNTTVPLLPLVLFLVYLLRMRIKGGVALEDILLISTYMWLCIAYSVSYIGGKSPSTLALIDNLTYVLPYLIGRSINWNTFLYLRHALLYSVVLCVAVLYVLTLFKSGGLSERIYSVYRSVNEYRNYIPVVLYSVVFILLSGMVGSLSKKQKLVCTVSLALFVVVSWSRTGILFGTLLLLFGFKKYFGVRVHGVLFALFVLIVAIVFLFQSGLYLVFADTVIGSRLIATGEVLDGDVRRLRYMQEGIERLFSSPLFGDAYVASLYYSPQGELYSEPRMFTPHNQLLEIGVRAGLVPMILFVWLMVIFATRMFKYSGPVGLIGLLAFCSLLSGFGQNVLTNYSGYFLWFIFGVGVSTRPRIKKNQRSRKVVL